MNRVLVLAEWRRAQQKLAAALLLAREGYREDAVAIAYYAVFHGASTALHMKAVEAKSHAAVRSLFGLHLIKAGEIEAEWGKLLATALDVRHAADYNPVATFTAKDVRKACRDARSFLRRIRAYLLENFFTAAELRTRRPKHG
jgi:uncharacterized protein (UPF0332 family)